VPLLWFHTLTFRIPDALLCQFLCVKLCIFFTWWQVRLSFNRLLPHVVAKPYHRPVRPCLCMFMQSLAVSGVAQFLHIEAMETSDGQWSREQIIMGFQVRGFALPPVP